MKTTKELTAKVNAYILDAIDSEAYEVVTTTEKEKLQFLYDTFKKEYGTPETLRYYKNNVQLTFANWIMGLPSVFNIDFENYRILEISNEWGLIKGDLSERQKEKREDFLIDGWFSFITHKTFMLFRKYGI